MFGSGDHSEESTIERLMGILPENGYNLGQAEETEAKPEAAAEPKREAEVKNTAPETETSPEESEVAPATADAQEPGAEEDAEIEVDGERYKVPSKLKSAFMMNSDYTKKTMELANQRKEWEADKGKIDPNLAQKLSHYENLLGDAVQADKQVDWAKLLQEDPIGYLMKKEQSEARSREFEQVNAKNQKEYVEKLSQAGTKEWEQLIAKQPDFKDAAKFKAHDERVKAVLAEQGYDPKEIGPALFDHRVRLMLDKVVKYDELQKAKAETVKKIEKLPPKIERPGVPNGTDSQGSKSAMSHVKKTGKVEDAAAAIRALMG